MKQALGLNNGSVRNQHTRRYDNVTERAVTSNHCAGQNDRVPQLGIRRYRHILVKNRSVHRRPGCRATLSQESIDQLSAILGNCGVDCRGAP